MRSKDERGIFEHEHNTHTNSPRRKWKHAEFILKLAPILAPSPEKRSSAAKESFPETELHRNRLSFSSSDCSSSGSGYFQGLLHFTWQRGAPRFVFVVDSEVADEVYAASVRKVGPAGGKPLDFIYLFYSCSSLVGKMKVSTSSRYNSDRSRLTESEFVLFGIKEAQHKSPPPKKKGLFRSKTQLSKSSGRCLIELLDEPTGPDSARDEIIFPTASLELAATVVRRREEPAGGGWGLKFLHKPGAGPPPAEAGGPRPAVVMLLPAGFHGGPATEGSSGLTQRWRSGGRCDCGGWDLGCPLTVFSSSSSGRSGSEEDATTKKTLHLFTEGREDHKGEPKLRVELVKDGMYRVSFSEGLTALQSFSAAIAFIHTQTPALSESSARCPGIDR